MANENKDRLPEERRKRVNRLKKIIIRVIIILIIIPNVISIILGIKLHSAKKQLAIANESLVKEMAKNAEAETEKELVVEDVVSVEDDNAQALAESTVVSAEIDNETTLTGTGNENANSSQDAEHKDGKKHVYLTFDDGPSSNTEKILDVLKEYNVKATFFVVGNTSDNGKELMKRIVDEGHTIGIHSFTHKYGQIYDSEEAYFEDYQKLSNFIYDTTGVRPNICRLPGGSSNTVSKISTAELVTKLNQEGTHCFDWNISGGDATGQKVSADDIARNVILGVNRFQTSVILLHDGGDKNETVRALPIILDEITKMDDVVIDKITEDTPVILHISLQN